LPDQAGSMLDRCSNQPVPCLEPGSCLGSCRGQQDPVAEQDGVERAQDSGAVLLGPFNWIRVRKIPVLRVGPLDLNANTEAAAGEIGSRDDVVAGEEMTACRRG